MPEIIDLYDNARQFVCSFERGSEMPDGLNKLTYKISKFQGYFKVLCIVLTTCI